ncbi:MAG: hypothetical protein AAF245_10160 [Pseudomonadota bacterium]
MVQEILGHDDYEDWKQVTSDPRSVGHAILSENGEAVAENGLSDMAAAVAANMFDVTEQMGELLGDGACKRFHVLGTGRNYVGVNYTNAAGLVVQTTQAPAEVKELRHVR